MFRKAIIVVVVSLVVMLIATVGCGREAAIVTRHHGMDLIPGDAPGGMYYDYKSLREDKDLSAWYDSMAAGQSGPMEAIGVSLSQIDFMAAVEGGVLGGRFDCDNVRKTLRGLDFEEGTYEGVELWTGYHSEFGDSAIAILEGGLIYGEPDAVKAHVRVINGTEVSLYQTEDIEQLMNRLPGWSPILLWLECDPSREMPFSDALAIVIAFGKADKDNLKLAVVVRFESESAAIEGLGGVDTLIEPMGAMEVEASRSGTFVNIEAKVPIQFFSQ